MWKTSLTKHFPCRIPIMGAPMAGVSGGKLAAETCRAGALGFIAAGHLQSVEALEEEIALFRKLSPSDDADERSSSSTTRSQRPYPLCLGFICHSALGTAEGWERFEYILDKHRPDVVQFFAPAIAVNERADDISSTNVTLAQKYNAKVMAQVGNVSEGVKAIDAGVDALIAQGSEAGGHGLRREQGNGTLALAGRLVQIAAEKKRPDGTLPVLAAGGIATGRGVAAALALGCDGAVLGTRLWCCDESIGDPSLQRSVVRATSCDEVTRTAVLDAIQNVGSSTPWPRPYDSLGAVRNRTTERWDGRLGELEAELSQRGTGSPVVAEYKQAQKEGNPDVAAVLCGEGVGEIESVEPAYDVITRINQETIAIIQAMPKLLLGED